MSDRQKSLENMIPMILDVEPLVLEVGSRLYQILKESSPESFADRMVRVTREAALALGLVLPNAILRQNSSLQSSCFVTKVREVEVQRGSLGDALSLSKVQQELERKITEILHRYAHEFLGLSEVQAFLSHLRSENPELVGSVCPSLLSLPEIRRILQNLLREGVPIRHLLKIFEALREYAIYTHDPDILTEYVRHALSRVIGSLYQESFIIRAHLLDREIEQLIAGAVRWEEGAFLEVDSAISDKIVKTLMKRFRKLRNPKKGNAVLLVSPDIRRFVRMLIERLAPEIPVLSISEIAPEYKVKTLGVISLDPWPQFIKRFLSFIRPQGTKKGFPGDDLQKALLILNLIGPASNQVVQHLSQPEREALRGRAGVAPIPAKGKEAVIREFISFLPNDGKVLDLESLIQFAGRDPLTLAGALQKNWLLQFGTAEENLPYGKSTPLPRGRDDTNPREKAAVFISGASRWVQEEVYRYLPTEDLRQVGYGMLQFPFISLEAKRKTWEDHELILQKDEWWDPETLARFVQACSQGKIEEFKKRGFRQAQKVAILLLSLPAQRAKGIGKGVLDHLPKSTLQQLLAEMSQWRDQIPVEARESAISEFLGYMASVEIPDFEFHLPALKGEVERIIHRDSAGAVTVMRNLWFCPPDSWSVFESLALQMPQRVMHHLLSFAQRPGRDNRVSNARKAWIFMNGVHPDLGVLLKNKLSPQEKNTLDSGAGAESTRKNIFREFLHGYYGGSYPTPLPFLKRN